MGVRGVIEDIQPFAELAQNATTVVYKAYQKSLERFVLLKRLRPEFSADEELSSRFQEEARLIARVSHPNIVSVYAYGSDADGAYIVAEYVDGQDLSSLIEQGGIPPEVALYVLLECARGLEAAHEKNVLHRDLKPSNTLVSNEGDVKLADFGMASLAGDASSTSGEIRGTLAYMAPEQVRGEEIDHRSDLFSLGAVFYEMLTGRRAFAGGGPGEILENVLHHDPQPLLAATPGVGSEIERICARMMTKNPSQRYADAGALIGDVESVRASDGAAVGRSELKAYLADPAGFASAARAREAVGVGKPGGVGEGGSAGAPGGVGSSTEGDAPDVSAHEPDGRRERSAAASSVFRRVAVAVVVVIGLAGIIYAGMAMRGQSESPQSERAIASEETNHASAASSVEEADGVESPGLHAVSPDRNAISPDQSAEASNHDAESAGRAAESDRVDGTGGELDRGATADLPGADDAGGEAAGEPDVDDPIRDAPPSNESDADAPERLERAPVASRGGEAEDAGTSGRLEVRAEPAAAVYVDGDSVGTATGGGIVSLPVAPGIYEVTLKNPYFPTYRQRVSVTAEATSLVDISLYDLVGRLDLDVRPWAVVYVDGDSIGVTPLHPPLILTPGVHSVRLVHEGLDVDHTMSVILERGDTLRREIDLTRLRRE